MRNGQRIAMRIHPVAQHHFLLQARDDPTTECGGSLYERHANVERQLGLRQILEKLP
jgi:hypothetical protein